MEQLLARISELFEMLDNGEITEEEFTKLMQKLEGEYNDIADAIARAIGNYKGKAETIKAEEQRLSARRTAIENRAERLKSYLQYSMETVGRPKFKTALYSFNIQNNPASVVVDDESKIPEEYWVPQPAKMDKKAMKEFLSTGECADWAHLEVSQSLRIR